MERLSYWPEAISQPRLLLTEGVDACHFCVRGVRAYGLVGFQAVNFGGINELPGKLLVLQLITGFDRVESLGVIRDAESDPEAALKSVRGALRKAGLPSPKRAFEIAPGQPKTAIFLFPGPAEADHKAQPGTLEDLCLRTVSNQAVLDCTNSFIDCVEQTGSQIPRRHKARTHAYLAANNRFVGMKIGEAAEAGAWDWEHPILGPFERLLRAL